MPGSPAFVVLSGATAYVAAETAGIHVVDMTDPSAPFLVGTLKGESLVSGAAADARALYAADLTGGVIIAPLRCPPD
jgi:hypothetical protein